MARANRRPDCGGDTPPPGPSFEADVRPILNARCVGCHDAGGKGGLELRSLAGVLAGGEHGPAITPCDREASLLYTKTGPRPPFGARMPAGGAPLTDAQRETICRWIAVTMCEAPDPACEPPPPGDAGEDTSPPSFAGIDYVDSDDDAGECVLHWDAAADDVSPPDAIVYLVYLAPQGGPLTYATPFTQATGSPATVRTAPGTRYRVVVRAADAAGNVDGNTFERDCDLR